MFLQKIRITNFRCLEDISIDFRNQEGKIRKSTLLIGENGTGKSNLIKAIATITAGSDALTSILRDVDSLISNGKDSAILEATLQTKNGDLREIKLEFRRGDSIRQIMSRAHESLDEIDRALEYTDRNYFVVGYGASRRINNDEFIQSKSSRHEERFAAIRTLFDPNAVLNPLESWAVDLDYQRGKSGIKVVKDVLNKFMNNVTFSRIDKKSRRLIFNTPDGLIPLEQLSDGYQNIAAWIGDLLYRITSTFQDYKNPLQARGVLLIDEVDLHLHPKWQRVLLDFLRTKLPNFQIIATTHSALTAQQADDDELLYLTRKENKVSIHSFNGSPQDMLISQLLTSPAFGVETDESFEIQKIKTTIQALQEKTQLSEREKNQLKRLESRIKEMPNRSFQTNLEKEQLALLKKIEKEVSK